MWNCFQEANSKKPTGSKKEVTSWKQKGSGYPSGCEVPSDDIYLAPYSRSKMLVFYKGCTVMLLISLYLH